LLEKIGLIVNETTTIKYIASTTKDLDQFGFDVELENILGTQGARGGHMAHTFYLYRCLNYYNNEDHDVECINPHIENLIEIASKKAMRLQRLQSNVDAVHNSLRPSRSRQPQTDTVVAGNELYSLLMEENAVVLEKRYIVSTRTRHYMTFNETTHIKGEFNVAALACLQKLTAVVAPSWDGKAEGKILLKIIRRNFKKNNVYSAIVYDITTAIIIETPIANIFGQFDYISNLPQEINVESLLEVNI
jgi:hypothetical protein